MADLGYNFLLLNKKINSKQKIWPIEHHLLFQISANYNGIHSLQNRSTSHFLFTPTEGIWKRLENQQNGRLADSLQGRWSYLY